jgi:hypothetical protein
MATNHTLVLVVAAVVGSSFACSRDAERASGRAPTESASPLAPTSVAGEARPSSSVDLPKRARGISKAVAFPPRNEPFAFRANDLEAKYRDGLHRSPNQSFVDIEGTIVWTQEYLRYRVNLCGHEDAIQRVFTQIDGGGIPPTCGNAPAGQVTFPPRDQPFDFRNRLEAKYRDELRRASSTTYVDVEGDIVWTQEYLRYRVSGCSHVDAVQKVMTQIDGGGVQRDCTPAPPPGPVASFVMRQNGSVTDACDIQGLAGTCTFDARASTPANAITRYSWEIRPGSLSEFTATGVMRDVDFDCLPTTNSSVPLRVKLTVRTRTGQTASRTRDLTLFRAGCGT